MKSENTYCKNCNNRIYNNSDEDTSKSSSAQSIIDNYHLSSNEKQNLLEKTLHCTPTDIALVLKYLYKDNLRFSNKNWYYYNNNKWNISDKTNSPIFNLIKTHLINEYLLLANQFNNKVVEFNNITELDEIIKNDYMYKAKLCNSVCIKLSNKSFILKINTICEKLFEDDLFIQKLNRNRNMIAFDNGVFNIKTKQLILK